MQTSESILTSVKKLIGISEDYNHFDTDLIMHINSVFMVLLQMGVGPEEGFAIEDDIAVWTDFVESGPLLSMVRSYMYLKVRMLFDPPSGAAAEPIARILEEYEWRISVAVNPKSTKEGIQNG